MNAWYDYKKTLNGRIYMDVDDLVAKISGVLDPLLKPDSSYALLDFPNHSNVGDSAIWLGELDYFRSMGCRIRYSCDKFNYDPEILSSYCCGQALFVHGGGNFGDIWYPHQKLRESVLRRFKEQPVVQLPQSIHYQSSKTLEATQRAVVEHKNFVLLVRDIVSQKFAKEHFECEVHLCPDMAFAMKRSRLKKFAPNKDIQCVYLSRTDVESRKEKSGSLPKEVLAVDWLDEQPLETAKYYRILDRIERRQWARQILPLQSVRFRFSEILAQKRLERGCRILCQSERVVTDRLHGMILATLLGRRVYAFDNSYGKLSSFYQTWKEFLPNVLFFENEEDAISAAFS